MYTIKPIETKYDGYRMRSRTEARYAVMFRACSLAYEYEMQGYSLQLGAFLPDFFCRSSEYGWKPRDHLPRWSMNVSALPEKLNKSL